MLLRLNESNVQFVYLKLRKTYILLYKRTSKSHVQLRKFYSGNGAVFSYDPIGCVQRVTYTASGSAEPLIIPFFDCQVSRY